jgi:hypothetical protein
LGGQNPAGCRRHGRTWVGPPRPDPAPKAPGARSAPGEFLSIYSPFNLISNPLVRSGCSAQPGGPSLLKARRALNRHWAFSRKKTGLSPKIWSPTSTCREATKQQQQKFSPNEPGGRANVFFRFTFLRYYYYVNVTFSSTLRYRSGHNVFVYVTLP